jgi:hypothetical protein
LMVFLMAHYAVDSIIILFTVVILMDQNDPASKIRAALWCINNAVFVVVFFYYYMSEVSQNHYYNALWWWFVNCCIALGITIFSRPAAGLLTRWGILHDIEGARSAAVASP